MTGLKVNYGVKIACEMQHFLISDLDKIANFANHVKTYGLENLEGRNKPSHEVPTDNPDWLVKVRYAQTHNLWHYHIGIPDYSGEFGDKTSEYVLHYIRHDDCIKIVDFSPHPPMKLPSTDYLA